jgi:hypothetical protein
MDREHNSETCPDKKLGHKDDANAHNTKGGSEAESFKRNQQKAPTGEKFPKK